jgi:site-specific DNA-methyltransferase (adenine-specific)
MIGLYCNLNSIPFGNFKIPHLTKMEENKIYYGNCMEVLPEVEDKSVNLILCDLPYEITQNKWDTKLNLQELFKQYWRVLKDNGTIVLTASQPFTTALINSEPDNFRYELIWDKVRTSGFLNANRMPLRSHESILIFYKKLGTYNPQFVKGEKSHSKGKMKTDVNNNYGKYGKVDNSEVQGNKKFPKSIISFIKPHPPIHPTQKPIELFEYLIKTYTNEGDLVLDNCIGSGTTAVACKQTNRRFIGIENNQDYVNMANKRLNFTTVGDFNPLNEESLISVKRESAESPNSPHDSLKAKEEANFS